MINATAVMGYMTADLQPRVRPRCIVSLAVALALQSPLQSLRL